MFSKKQLITVSLILALLFHFIFYFHIYGPHISSLESPFIFLLPIGSAFIMIIIYLFTYWRAGIKGSLTRWGFDLLVLWIFVCFVRSLIEMRSISEIIPYLFSSYVGLVMFPVLYFVVGLNINYFFSVNKLLSIYFFVVAFISIFFITYSELQHFLLLFIFYMILTIPLRSFWPKLLILIISISVVIFSLTNRAEIIRITVSYLILIAYYLLLYKRINKKLLYLIVFILLAIPAISLYLGFKGQSVFQMKSSDASTYSELDPYADTRTFLYYEVYLDLKQNNAILFGKGMSSGYYSDSFKTSNRLVVEVGFLQIILKTGVFGFILYITVIISSIVQALSKSRNQFIKSLGMLLATYVVMLFIENIIAYNLLNIVIWIIVGMCNSVALRNLSDSDIRKLFNDGSYIKSLG